MAFLLGEMCRGPLNDLALYKRENEWSVLGTGTWQRQLEGWIFLAGDFRELQFIEEFMAVGV